MTSPTSSQEQPSEYAVLQVRDVIHGSKDSYTVEGYLGEGLTSIVYEAKLGKSEEKVALKILRPGANTLSVENYWNEGIILNTLRDQKITCVPKVYEVHREAPPYFIAMQYVDPQEYPGVDALIEKDGCLPEADALEFGIQSLEMLLRLHTKVERSYTDMQLKNFCWDGKKKKIMVMDWNHVSYQRKDIEQGIKSRSEAVLTQLERRGADDFEGLVRLDLERFATFFYMAATGKAAMEKGETAWTLATRAGEKWQGLSEATRQAIITALVPHPELDRFSNIAEFLKALRAAQALSQNEDYDSLRDEAGDALDKVEELHTEDADKQDWQKVFKTNRTIQLEYGRAFALLDRIRAIKDSLKDDGTKDALTRWLRHQEERLEKIKGRVSAAWGIGRRYYDDGQYATACGYMEPEAKRQGRVDLWRRYLAAAGLSELSTQGLEREVIVATRDRLDVALDSLEKGNLHDAATELQSALGMFKSIPERFRHLKNEIQSLSNVYKARELGPDSDKLAALKEAVAPVKEVPYSSILMRDRLWYIVLDDWLEADHEAIDSYTRSGTVNIPLLIEKVVTEVKNRDALRRNEDLEINKRLSPMLEFLEAIPFPVRADFNELKEYLVHRSSNKPIQEKMREFVQNTKNRRVALGALDLLATLTDITTEERNDLFARYYIHWLDSAIQEKNWQLASLFDERLRSLEQENHRVFQAYLAELDKYNDEVGNRIRQLRGQMQTIEAQQYVLKRKEDFLARVDEFLSIKVREKQIKELGYGLGREAYQAIVNEYNSKLTELRREFSTDLGSEETYREIIQNLENNQQRWADEIKKKPIVPLPPPPTFLWIWAVFATVFAVGLFITTGLLATGTVPPFPAAQDKTPDANLTSVMTASPISPIVTKTPIITEVAAETPTMFPTATPVPSPLPQGLGFVDRHDVCPFANDAKGNVIYFDLSPLQISFPKDWQWSLNPNGSLITQQDGSLLIQQSSNPANQGGLLVFLDDVPVTGDGEFVLGSALFDKSGHQCKALDVDASQVFWLPAPYLTGKIYGPQQTNNDELINCSKGKTPLVCSQPPSAGDYTISFKYSLDVSRSLISKPISIKSSAYSGVMSLKLRTNPNWNDANNLVYSITDPKTGPFDVLFTLKNGIYFFAAIRFEQQRAWFWATCGPVTGSASILGFFPSGTEISSGIWPQANLVEVSTGQECVEIQP